MIICMEGHHELVFATGSCPACLAIAEQKRLFKSKETMWERSLDIGQERDELATKLKESDAKNTRLQSELDKKG